MYIPPFDMYFFATLAIFLLPFAYAVFHYKWILAIFVFASCYDAIEFYVNQDFWVTPAFLAVVGFFLLAWEILKDLSQEEPYQELETEEAEEIETEEICDPRMHPNRKPIRRLLPANIKERIIKCLKCGGENKVPETAQSAICQYCGRNALSPA